MEFDSIECVSSSDGIEEDEISQLHPHIIRSQFSSSKTTTHKNSSILCDGNNGGIAIHPATSVHELLECPVCTNSMYPPIHQDQLQWLMGAVAYSHCIQIKEVGYKMANCSQNMKSGNTNYVFC